MHWWTHRMCAKVPCYYQSNTSHGNNQMTNVFFLFAVATTDVTLAEFALCWLELRLVNCLNKPEPMECWTLHSVPQNCLHPRLLIKPGKCCEEWVCTGPRLNNTTKRIRPYRRRPRVGQVTALSGEFLNFFKMLQLQLKAYRLAPFLTLFENVCDGGREIAVNHEAAMWLLENN